MSFGVINYHFVSDRQSSKPESGNFNQKRVSLDKFVGTKFRSVRGCKQCRSRRKKCDETHPKCNACVKRNIECEWRDQSGKNASKKVSETDKGNATYEATALPYIQPHDAYENALKADVTLGSAIPLDSDSIVELELPLESDTNIESQLMALSQHTSGESIVSLPQFELNFFEFPKFFFNFFMDSKGAAFVEHFESKVSKSLTVSPSTSNYFSKTFLQLANIDESIGHAIASWGAFYVHQHEHEDVKHHLRKAMVVTAKRFPRTSELSKYDRFTLLCFYLIVLGTFVCQGDVRLWWSCFKECHEIINKSNGLFELCQELHFSNDIKFLISNFFYHDVMNSDAFLHAPLIPIDKYRALFTADFFDSLYGIDPLQGCLNPVYLLLAEELEVFTAIEARQKRLDDLLGGELDLDDENVSREFDIIRAQHFEFCEELIKQIEQKLLNCDIDHRMLEHVTENEANLHKQVFALFMHACKMYWALFIKKILPKSCEVQLILMKLVEGLEKLVDTGMVVVLCLPLLLASAASYAQHDRSKLRKLTLNIIDKCPVQNVRRAWEVIQKCWERNPDGDKLVNWAEVCRELGWHLCVC